MGWYNWETTEDAEMEWRVSKIDMGADILDRMNRIDRMAQTNIQILSIL